jgi:Glutamyl- and glutaminyl-tRNA synthetases
MAEEANSKVLEGRKLEWAENSPAALQAHKDHNGPIVRTRFPPEPNGYLHIGHAKSMNMNFSLAFEKLGVPIENRRTIFRYDDTNPEAESEEYIDSLQRDLTWLGWEPERTTYSSDNFQQLYEFAVILIKKGLAYVCDMSKQEVEVQRELAMKRANARNKGLDPDEVAPIPSRDILPGRNRDTCVERNLKLFENMRLGMYEEGQYTLRLKMDFESSNPNMYDLVAYRIKYTRHPHAGDGWCMYPSYDWTHGICDSLEHIDYSICTLEFETRREPYYWILWALDLYKPKVYEMSRLNIEYTVLSKRRLIKLVDSKYVRGWDDPRMPTISGLRRRGYTKEILNSFCNDVGATRAMNVVEMEKLFQTARLNLSATSRRAMAALDPIKVIITNYAEELEKKVATD